MVKDLNALQYIIDFFDTDFVNKLKFEFGSILERLVKEMFNLQGTAVPNTDPNYHSSVNPKWQELSDITKRLKGSSQILKDTDELRNWIRWQIEDSDFDDMKQVVKVGWFEDSGDRAWIAAIHEFGLTGVTYQAVDGSIMGGDPIGRTPEARAKIRYWYNTTTKEVIGGKIVKSGLNLRVSGVVVIPERSMLRKAMDFFIPNADDRISKEFDLFLEKQTLKLLTNIP